jgi:hypothetical protein
VKKAEQILPGSKGDRETEGAKWGQGEEMVPIMYAHMNK